MNTTLQQDVLEETYYDMEALIYGVVKKIWLIYGGNFEELICDANLLFIEAMKEFDKSRASLSTFLTLYIRGNLTNMIRNSYRESHIKPTYVEDYEGFEPIRLRASVVEILDELNQDAKEVLVLLLGKNQKRKRKTKYNRYGGACHIRKEIRDTLVKEMEWTIPRVAKSFNEIKNALTTMKEVCR